MRMHIPLDVRGRVSFLPTFYAVVKDSLSMFYAPDWTDTAVRTKLMPLWPQKVVQIGEMLPLDAG